MTNSQEDKINRMEEIMDVSMEDVEMSELMEEVYENHHREPFCESSEENQEPRGRTRSTFHDSKNRERDESVRKSLLKVKFNFKSLTSKIRRGRLGKIGIYLTRQESSPERPSSQEMSPVNPGNSKA